MSKSPHLVLLCCATVLASIAILAAPAQAQQKSAKACETEWTANKASIQGSGKTKKAFMIECRSGSGPVAKAPSEIRTGRAGGRDQGDRSRPPAYRQTRPDKPNHIHGPGGICFRGGGKNALPWRHGGLGQYPLENLPLRRLGALRAHEARRIYVREGHRLRRSPLRQEREAPAIIGETSSRKPHRGLAGIQTAQAFVTVPDCLRHFGMMAGGYKPAAQAGTADPAPAGETGISAGAACPAPQAPRVGASPGTSVPNSSSTGCEYRQTSAAIAASPTLTSGSLGSGPYVVSPPR